MRNIGKLQMISAARIIIIWASVSHRSLPSSVVVRKTGAKPKEQTNGITHELYPLSIVVHGKMAVVHYTVYECRANERKKTDISSGRYTAVLVRDDGDWKFISWHDGSDD